jgi:hypothetical protein
MRGSWNSTQEGYKVVYTCIQQEASAVHQKVKELQERVAHLMIVIVDHVTVKYEEGSEVVVKAVEGIEKDMKELLRCASYTLTIVDC